MYIDKVTRILQDRMYSCRRVLYRGGREATGAVTVCEAALLGAARSLSPSLSLHLHPHGRQNIN